MAEQAREPIRLDQFLKLMAVTSSGGQAKALIQGGGVTVNGEVETRRGRKLALGDVIRTADGEWTVDASIDDAPRDE